VFMEVSLLSCSALQPQFFTLIRVSVSATGRMHYRISDYSSTHPEH